MNPDPTAPEPQVAPEDTTPATSVVIPKSTVTRPANPSQYMRTFAKDIAALTGKAATPVAPLAREDSDVVPVGVTDVSVKDGVSSSVFENEKREVLDTSQDDEKEIFEKDSPKPVRAVIDTLPQFAPIIPATHVDAVGSSTIPVAVVAAPASVPAHDPAPVPTPIPTQAPVMMQFPKMEPPLQTAEAREKILTRLREKVAAQNAQKPVEEIPAHREINLLAQQGSLEEKTIPKITDRVFEVPLSKNPEPVIQTPRPIPVVVTSPPVPKAVKPSYIPPQAPKPYIPPALIRPPIIPVRAPEPLPVSPLHTYSSDFADRIDERKASAFSVLAAQSDSGTTTIRTTTTTSRPVYIRIALGIFVLLLGIGIVGSAVYFFSKNNVVPVVITTIPSIIPYDEAVVLTDRGAGYMSALRAASVGTLVSGNILVTYITLASSTSLGGSAIPQQGGALIAAMKTGAPDILLRNVSASSTVGVVNAGGTNQPFFILAVDSYERTFAGMLAWENTMTQGLATLYPTLPPLSTTVIKTTPAVVKKGVVVTVATSTIESVLTPPTNIPGFVDTVIANHDVREYKDSYGRTIIVYGYKDKSTLIITGSEQAFAVLIDRLNSAQTK